MKTTYRRLITLGVALLCAAPVAFAAPISVKDARGKLVSLSGPPKRILSIAPSNTEILYALGLESKIVGVTDYCDYPAQAKVKPKVGGIILNHEKMIALKPDLVVAFYDLQKGNIPQIERLGLRVFAIDPHSTQETMDAILQLGRVTGALPKARQVVSAMKGELARARRIVQRTPKRPRTLAIIQKNPLIVAGPRTFMDDALRQAGAQNLAGDAKQLYPQFSLEIAIARKPEVLLLSAAQPDEFLGDSVWRTTPAVQNRKVYSPPFMAELERPGPRLAGAIRKLAGLLHYPHH